MHVRMPHLAVLQGVSALSGAFVLLEDAVPAEASAVPTASVCLDAEAADGIDRPVSFADPAEPVSAVLGGEVVPEWDAALDEGPADCSDLCYIRYSYLHLLCFDYSEIR